MARLELPALTVPSTSTLGVDQAAFAALVLLVAVAAGIGDVAAEKPATYEPHAVEYIEGLIAEPGISTTTETIGSKTWSVTTDVRLASPGEYHVVTTAGFNDSEPEQVSYEIQVIKNGTYRIIIEDIASDVTYTDVAEVAGGGSGRSDEDRADIRLHDREYGASGIELSDVYNACIGRTLAKFTANVHVRHTFVSWETNDSYWNFCIIPHGFRYMTLEMGGVTVTTVAKTGSHEFLKAHNNPVFNEVNAAFYYGDYFHPVMITDRPR